MKFKLFCVGVFYWKSGRVFVVVDFRGVSRNDRFFVYCGAGRVVIEVVRRREYSVFFDLEGRFCFCRWRRMRL